MRFSTNTIGAKYNFQLNNVVSGNHLGNVLTVVSDRKIAVDNNNDNIVDYFLPDVVSATDYYAFGGKMAGRSFNNNSMRYQFNGKEFDQETGTQDYGARIYNPNLGRFLSVDPLGKDFAWNSPYSFAENDVIRAVDLDGKEKRIVVKVRDNAGKIIAMKITTNIANRNVMDQFITQRNPDGTQQQIQDSNGQTYNNEGVVVLDYDSRGVVTVTFKKETELDKFETDVMSDKLKDTDIDKNFVKTTKLDKNKGFKDVEYSEEYRTGDADLKISNTYKSGLTTYEKDGGILKEAIYLDESSTTLDAPPPVLSDVLDNIVKKVP